MHFCSVVSLCLDMAPSQSRPLENHAALGRRLRRKTSPASLFITETVVPAQACAACPACVVAAAAQWAEASSRACEHKVRREVHERRKETRGFKKPGP